MVKKEIIDTAMEMTKNIPSTDSNVSKNDFDNDTTCNNENILTPLQQEDVELAPYPKVEYKIIEAPTMDKLVRDVNTHLANGRVCDGGVQVSGSPIVRFYQSVERRNVDSGPEQADCIGGLEGIKGTKPEMPSKNSEAGAMGGKPALGEGMKFLENEPDLYEDVTKDGTTLQRK